MNKYLIALVAFAAISGWYLLDGRYSYTTVNAAFSQRIDHLTGATVLCTKAGC